MTVKISPNSRTFPFGGEHPDTSYKFTNSSGAGSPSSNKCSDTTANHGPAGAKTDNGTRRQDAEKTGKSTRACYVSGFCSEILFLFSKI